MIRSVGGQESVLGALCVLGGDQFALPTVSQFPLLTTPTGVLALGGLT